MTVVSDRAVQPGYVVAGPMRTTLPNPPWDRTAESIPAASVSFSRRLVDHDISDRRVATSTVQVNLGAVCNQACRHCHVEAGPRRTESMTEETALRIVHLLSRSPGIQTVDLTGGAPELNPWFRMLVAESRHLGKRVIDRSNLTVLLEEGQEGLAVFLRDQGVEILASLPCYLRENVDRQRGRGVFDKSIRALRYLNRLGYGRPGSGLRLDLVHNPADPMLPGAAAELERAYRLRLLADYEITFGRLLTLANVPIHRFREDLRRRGALDEYRELLEGRFNPKAAEGVMCRSLVSVGWRGELHDCDFNLVLGWPLGGRFRTVFDIQSFDAFDGERIAFGDHCYACTAGQGSSCGGAIVDGYTGMPKAKAAVSA